MEQFELFLKTEFNITEYPWRNANHEPTLTTEQMREKQKKQEEQFEENLLNLMNLRGHELRTATGYFTHSEIVVYCPIHKKLHTTKVTNYKKSKTGMPCCGKQIQDAKRKHDHLNPAKERLRQQREKDQKDKDQK